mmetsp:Transcript_814/g.2222  ORF Transcript_814/g.2222 Transcript_814/m.2222 type:complete len:380 (-) Transcript_814:331-1470(-)
MGSYGQSPFTPNAPPFGGGGYGYGGGSGYGSAPFSAGGAAPDGQPGTNGGGGGGGATPKPFAPRAAADLGAAAEAWSWLLPSAAPRAETSATPASRFRPASGPYGFSGPGAGAPPDSPFAPFSAFPVGALDAGAGAQQRGGSPGLMGSEQQQAEALAAQAAAELPPTISMLDGGDSHLQAPGGLGGFEGGQFAPRPFGGDSAGTPGLGSSALGVMDPWGDSSGGWAPSSLSNVSSGHWVTVFGFAPESFPQLLRALQPSSSAALAHAQGGGNWAHLRLGSELEVEEALAKNGRLVCGNMIGILRGILPTPADADAAAALHQSAKQTVWLAAAAPAIDARAQVRQPLGGSGVVGGGALQPIAQPGLGALLLRLTEYILGW